MVPAVLVAGSGSAHRKSGESGRKRHLVAECHPPGGGCRLWRRAFSRRLPCPN